MDSIIWREGKWSVESFGHRHHLYHEDLPGIQTISVSQHVWKKRYGSDPKAFRDKWVERRLVALETWSGKISVQQGAILAEMEILKGNK